MLGGATRLREDDLALLVVLAAVRQRVPVLEHHRDEAGVVAEALPDDVPVSPSPLHGADLVHLRALRRRA